MNLYQQEERITVPGSGTARFTLAFPALVDNLTIWAVSGSRTIANLSFQVQINAVNYNAATTVVAAVAADVIYRSGGASTENDLIPLRPSGRALTLDPFTFSVLITNADVADAVVTLYAVGKI